MKRGEKDEGSIGEYVEFIVSFGRLIRKQSVEKRDNEPNRDG